MYAHICPFVFLEVPTPGAAPGPQFKLGPVFVASRGVSRAGSQALGPEAWSGAVPCAAKVFAEKRPAKRAAPSNQQIKPALPRVVRQCECPHWYWIWLWLRTKLLVAAGCCLCLNFKNYISEMLRIRIWLMKLWIIESGHIA